MGRWRGVRGLTGRSIRGRSWSILMCGGDSLVVSLIRSLVVSRLMIRMFCGRRLGLCLIIRL